MTPLWPPSLLMECRGRGNPYPPPSQLLRHARIDAQQRIERESAGAEEHEGEADRQQCQRQLDSVKGGEEFVPSALGVAESIGELHDERGHEHRASEEESIESRQKPGDQEDGAEQLGVRGGVAEEHGEAVRGHVLRERGRAAGAEDLPPAVRQEDQPGREPQHECRDINRPLFHLARILGPILLLCALYLATVFALGVLAAAVGWPYLKWIDLVGIVAATAATIAIAEGGRWSLGLAIMPRAALAELAGGIVFAGILIVAGDRLIAISASSQSPRPCAPRAAAASPGSSSSSSSSPPRCTKSSSSAATRIKSCGHGAAAAPSP